MIQHTTSAIDELTKQERNVLALVAKGWRNAKIAQELYISPRTVESHLYRIFDKLGVSSRTEAALHSLSAELSGISQDGIDSRRYSKDIR